MLLKVHIAAPIAEFNSILLSFQFNPRFYILHFLVAQFLAFESTKVTFS
jgi:hypothetical protein